MKNIKSLFTMSLYWEIQITAWSVSALYWFFMAFLESEFLWSIGISDFILDVWIGIGITHAYKSIAYHFAWLQLGLKQLSFRILFAVLVLAALYLFLIMSKLYFVRWIFMPNFDTSFNAFLLGMGLQIFVTGIRIMAIWVLAFHLYHYAKREINGIKENARLSIAIKEAQLNNLNNQLNPHFFFNALNNIKFMVSHQPQSARRAIDLLADVLRNAMHKNTSQWIELSEEIQLVSDYLELESLRFEERLESHLDVDTSLLKLKVMPLCIQVLVENAIKHGIEKKKQKGFIEVKVSRVDGFVSICVKNSGELISPFSNVGIGLQNLNERLTLQYNGKASFVLKALNDSTVLAHILIPIV